MIVSEKALQYKYEGNSGPESFPDVAAAHFADYIPD